MIINKKNIRAILLVNTALFSLNASADLNTEMDQMFGSLVNVTPAGSYKSSSRGVFHGGRVTIRNELQATPKLLTFDPPKFSSGCGGIDMYGGSFSFISKDALQNYMRNIASNATTYAFGLAIEAMCPTCKQGMDKLQAITNKLNSNLANSCKSAQWLVKNSGIEKIAKTAGGAVNNTMVSTGVTDLWDSEYPEDKISSASKLAVGNPVEAKKIAGNLVWDLIKKQDIASWFTNGDDELRMVIMSMLGTVIIQELDGANNDSDIDVRNYNGHMITLASLIDGDISSKYLQCNVDPEDRCLSPDPLANYNLAAKGIRQRIANLLFGDNVTSVGIIDKYRFANSQELTDAEKSFIENSPAVIGVALRNLSTDIGLVTEVMNTMIDSMAIEMAIGIVENLHRIVMGAVYTDKRGLNNSEQIKVFYHALKEYRAEAELLRVNHKSPAEYLELYAKARSIMIPKHLNQFAAEKNK
jgi:conjugative transfer pilus assembly protein TraH